jgi:hypothetical protein
LPIAHHPSRASSPTSTSTTSACTLPSTCVILPSVVRWLGPSSIVCEQAWVSMGGAKGWAGWATAHPDFAEKWCLALQQHCSSPPWISSPLRPILRSHCSSATTGEFQMARSGKAGPVSEVDVPRTDSRHRACFRPCPVATRPCTVTQTAHARHVPAFCVGIEPVEWHPCTASSVCHPTFEETTRPRDSMDNDSSETHSPALAIHLSEQSTLHHPLTIQVPNGGRSSCVS